MLAVLAATVVVLAMAVTAWYQLESHALGPAGAQVVVHVAPGESINAVVSTLADDKVIGSALAFKVSDVVHGTLSVSPGDYALHENETFGQVRAILGRAPNVYAITVEPGYVVREVAERVDALPGHGSASFAQVAASGTVRSSFLPAGTDNVEGLLGSGNYLVVPGETDTSLLRTMVQRFESQAAAAGVTAAAASALGMTPYQLITVASIVEKEGYIIKNMPDVARVIYNRLASGTALQMDSTVLYSLGQDGGPVTPADEQLPSPYNTYLNKGLPPTPICVPSPSALAAAAHPPAGGWLFFELVDKDGTEAFADTYAEQLVNEQLAQSRGLG